MPNLLLRWSQRVRNNGFDCFLEGSGIPITVRQLEAIIRISEALAKMTLSNVVKPDHVNEAHRLFKVRSGLALFYICDIFSNVDLHSSCCALWIHNELHAA